MSRGDLRAAQREKWALYYKPSFSEGIKGKFWGKYLFVGHPSISYF
jgi:hypothetical protein